MPRTVCWGCHASLGPLPRPTPPPASAPSTAPAPPLASTTVYRRPANVPGSYPSRDALTAALARPAAPPSPAAAVPVSYAAVAPSPPASPAPPTLTYPLPSPPPPAAPASVGSSPYPAPTAPGVSPPSGGTPFGGPATPPPDWGAYALPPKRKSRAKTIVVVVVIVVLVIVLAAVASALVFRPSTTGTSNGPAPQGTPLDETAVARAGEARENTTSGGPWTLTAVYGLGLPGGYNGSAGFIQGCSTVWENSSNLVLPKTPASAASGEVAGWLMFASGPSSELLITDVYQTGAAIVTSNTAIFKGSCTTVFTTLGDVPSPVVDSTTVVASANAMGGTSFLSTHAVQSVQLLLLGAYWTIEYSTCPYFATGGTGTNFTALFDATDGDSLQPASTTTATC